MSEVINNCGVTWVCSAGIFLHVYNVNTFNCTLPQGMTDPLFAQWALLLIFSVTL